MPCFPCLAAGFACATVSPAGKSCAWGPSGCAGLAWPDLLRGRAAAANPASRRETNSGRFRQGPGLHPDLQLRRAFPPRPVGPQARRPGGNPRRVQARRHLRAGHRDHRAPSPPGVAGRPLRHPPRRHAPRQRPRHRHLPGPDRLFPPEKRHPGHRAARHAAGHAVAGLGDRQAASRGQAGLLLRHAGRPAALRQ